MKTLSLPDPFASPNTAAIALWRTSACSLPDVLRQLPPAQAKWVQSNAFDPQPGRLLPLPDASGGMAAVLAGVDTAQPALWQLADLPHALPPGTYALQDAASEAERAQLLLGWAIGALPPARPATSRLSARLQAGPDERHAATTLASAIGLVRHLVNQPANLLGPAQLAACVQTLALAHGASYREWIGDALPDAGFPLVHAVGRAAADAPRVAELCWGDASLPQVVIIGKGVCFDAGGLDIKPAAGMRWMKKDMGGAAHAIALARLVMQAGLRLHLKLLVPAVENTLGAGAMRPGDIIAAADGRLVEIENTDAEGRLLLADALHHAIGKAAAPAALVIDLATLTGAARMALGPDLPALFSNHDGWADALQEQGRKLADPMWRLPLWAPYRRMLKSGQADMLNAASLPQAGAITAALFLENFVPAHVPWLHLDLFAWNLEERPGRPKGGEAQCLRALFALLSQRFAAD